MNFRQGDLLGLVKRKKQLELFIQSTQARLKVAPEGAVRIIKHGNGYQFFHRREPKEKSGVYIPASEFEKARALIQKKYDLKILAVCREQLALIDHFLSKYDSDVLKRIYAKSGEVRKQFIQAAELPDEDFRARWRAFEYSGKEFREGAAEHYTLKGERVRSKSEVMIANVLSQAGLDYRYEYPVMLGSQIVYSDFTVLRMTDRKEIRWEHAGMIDDLDYRNEFLGKIALYEENGFFPGEDLILTAETQKRPFNIRDVQRVVNHYFF
jgi:hypothetical protein